jgi:hypothetical protein
MKEYVRIQTAPKQRQYIIMIVWSVETMLTCRISILKTPANWDSGAEKKTRRRSDLDTQFDT